MSYSHINVTAMHVLLICGPRGIYIGYRCSCCIFVLVCMISCQGFNLEFLYLHRMCILGPSGTVWKISIYWPWSSRSYFRQRCTLPYLRDGLIQWQQTKTFMINGLGTKTWMLKMIIELKNSDSESHYSHITNLHAIVSVEGRGVVTSGTGALN